MHAPIETLLDDPGFIVVNKPPEVLTIPGRMGGASIRDLLARQGVAGELLVVHRLDRETSGVLLLARHAEAHRSLSEQFRRREVAKTYLAFVQGGPDADAGEVDAPLARHPRKVTRMVIDARLGKPSSTRWEVLERWGPVTLLRCHPLTGRQHQIRVHLAYAGMPLLVDGLYGHSSGVYLSQLKPGYKRRAGREERPIVARLTLHAESLTFSHPDAGATIRVEAPLPKDLRALLSQLRRLRSGFRG